jgi:RimK family alpha-L-glutamate ligase
MKVLAMGFTNAKFFNEHVKKEIEARGHEIDFCSANKLVVDVGREKVDIRCEGLDLATYDVIHVGAIASNRWTTLAALGYLHKISGCKIIDKRLLESTLDAYSGLAKYFLEHEHEIHFPRSITFHCLSEIEHKLSEFSFPVIVKTNSSKQGKGVGIAHTKEEINAFTERIRREQNRSGFILRELIPNDGDYRVNVIDGEVVICMKRTPAEGEFRSNISLGGKLTNVPLDEAKEVCDAAQKIATLANYDIAGVDVMVHKETGIPYILEVNRAPSDLEDDEEVSGVNLAGLIVDLYEKRHAL